MYNPSLSRPGQDARTGSESLLSRVGEVLRTQATTANIVGLMGALFALFCLLAPLPTFWNIRLPLYLVLVIWTLLRPRVALYLLPLAIPWGSLDKIGLSSASANSADVTSGGINSADILVLLLAVSWLASFVLRTRAAREATDAGPLDYDVLNVPRYLVLALLALLFTMLLSTITALSLSSSLKEIVKWIEVLIVLLVGARYLRTRRQIWILVAIMLLTGVSQAFYGYIQNFFNLGPQAFVRDAGLRVYGTFDQPNPYAGYINMSLPIALALLLLGRNWATRILAGFAALLLTTAEYLSQSRGGEIAITIAFVFIITVGIPRLRRLVSAGAIGALCIVGAYLAGIVPERFLLPILRILGLIQISFTAPSAQDFSTAERLAHWIAGVNMFLDHPFLGVGIGNYQNAYTPYHIAIFVNSLGHAHNYYINIAAETGILGLIAFLLFLLAIFVAGGRAYRAISKSYMQMKAERAKPRVGASEKERRKIVSRLGILTNDRALAVGLLAALLAVCVHNMVDDLYVHGMTILFVLLLVALIRLAGVSTEVVSNGGHHT